MRALFVLLTLLGMSAARADAPIVVDADAVNHGGRWTITVTLRHHDIGWDHFANRLVVLTPDGTRIGTADLTHPSVGKGRITARVKGLKIPAGTVFVLIRSRCNLVGWAAEPVRVDLPQ